MYELLYEGDFTLYLSYFDFEFYKQSSISDCQMLTYKDLIKEIQNIPDKSAAWKRLAVVQAGLKAGILKEVA